MKRGKRENRKTDPGEDEVLQAEASRFTAVDLLFLLLIAGLVVLFFNPAALGGKVFFAGDVMNVYNPYQAINAEQLSEGKMPLWTDRFFCGFPLFAESQGAVFYPPTRLAYALVPIHLAFTLDALFHFFLAGAFMYLLARYLGQRPIAAMFSATAFAFSGLFCSLIINFTIFRSAVWIPLVLYLARRCLREHGIKWTFLLALTLMLQMMGGSLQVSAITALLVAIDTVYVVLASISRQAFFITLVRVLKLALGFGFAVGFYAFQLSPTYELTGLSMRGVEASYEIASSYSFPAQHLIDIAMPNYYGNPSSGAMLPGIPPAPNFFGYIGVIALALAIYALGSRRSGIFGPVAIIFAVLALGPAGRLFDVLYNSVPFFDKFRAPDRFLIVFIFAASLLAGFGAERILSRMDEEDDEDEDEEEPVPPSKAPYIFALILLAIIAIIGSLPWFGSTGKAAFDGLMQSTLAGPLGIRIDSDNFAQYEAWRNLVPAVILYFVAFAAAIPLMNIIFGRSASPRALVFAFLIINLCDLFLVTATNHNNRLIDGRFFLDDPDSVAFIKEKSPNSRIYSYGQLNYASWLFGDKPVTVWYQGGGGSDERYFALREMVPPDLSAYFGLYDAGGFASLYTEDFYLLDGAVKQQLNDIVTGRMIPADTLTNGRPLHLLIDLMDVDFLISSYQLPEGGRFERVYQGDVLIYRNHMALPRAYVVHPEEVIVVDNSDIARLAEIAGSIGGFDFERKIILSSGSNVPTFTPEEAGITTRITPTIIEPERITATVEINRPGVLVLADSFYPGWHAKVDGKDAEILRANLYFRGVVLNTPGTHEVEFVYKPASFTNGIYISLLSLVLFILLAVGKRFIDGWYQSPEKEKPSNGTSKIVRYGLFGRKVTYEGNDEDEEE